MKEIQEKNSTTKSPAKKFFSFLCIGLVSLFLAVLTVVVINL